MDKDEMIKEFEKSIEFENSEEGWRKMRQGKFNALNALFTSTHFRMQYLPEHPQCEDCEYIRSITADWATYRWHIKPIFCKRCDKYVKEGEKDGSKRN